MPSTADCTHVTPDCPVNYTLYGYYPNLSVNAFFTALFATLLLAQLTLGAWKKTWSYTIWVSIGCLGELLGYIGRLIMHSNPWNQAGLEIQICCLVLAPSFLAAGIYLTLKHSVIHAGREYSRVKPEWYPWIFVGCDLFSIFIQAIGGGVAAASGASGNESLANTGDDLIMAGIAIQIFSMLVFGVLAIDYYQRRKKALHKASHPLRSTTSDSENDNDKPILPPSTSNSPTKDTYKTTIFYYAMCFAYITILIRCIYRIHEMAGGWGNPRMRDEPLFLILDGMMVALASVAMTVAHPGLLFPAWKVKRDGAGNLVDSA